MSFDPATPAIYGSRVAPRTLVDLIAAEDGATSIDYALLGALVVVLMIAGLALVGDGSAG
jgi:Flp pilus assembly pilin Flp